MNRDDRGPVVGDGRVHRDLPIEVLVAVHAATWDACRTNLDVPAFGSWAWTQLTDDDPAREYAILRAALAWWWNHAFGPGLPADVLDRLVTERLAQTSREVSAAADWRAIANRPTREEIERRRAQPGPMAGDAA